MQAAQDTGVAQDADRNPEQEFAKKSEPAKKRQYALKKDSKRVGKVPQKAYWSYSGNTGPHHWGRLVPGYRTCGLGKQQSPVDLVTPVAGDIGEISIDWKEVSWIVANNGHTIQANPQKTASTLRFGDKEYTFLQFHFHHMSEHAIEGQRAPMEAHFVYQATDKSGKLAVIAVMLEEGKENLVLKQVWKVMPDKAGIDVGSPVFNADGLLPESREYYAYMGSLTTPPCSETVSWIVMKEPVFVSQKQIRQFAGLYKNNARPVQEVNRRFILRSF